MLPPTKNTQTCCAKQFSKLNFKYKQLNAKHTWRVEGLTYSAQSSPRLTTTNEQPPCEAAMRNEEKRDAGDHPHVQAGLKNEQGAALVAAQERRSDLSKAYTIKRGVHVLIANQQKKHLGGTERWDHIERCENNCAFTKVATIEGRPDHAAKVVAVWHAPIASTLRNWKSQRQRECTHEVFHRETAFRFTFKIRGTSCLSRDRQLITYTFLKPRHRIATENRIQNFKIWISKIFWSGLQLGESERG